MENALITNQKKKRKGFTLIELIIVLAVMAIIAAIAIPNLAGVKNNAAVRTDTESSKTIKRSIEVLIADDTLKDVTGTFQVKGEGVFDFSKLSVTAENDPRIVAIKDALAGIKAPQAKDMKYFEVGILDSGVTVKTEK